VREGKIPPTLTRHILSIPEDAQLDLYRKVIENNWNQDQVQTHVRAQKPRSVFRRNTKDLALLEREEMLREVLGTRVEITRREESGTIHINFYSTEQFEDLIKKLASLAQ
jgi:hypothetical protein